MALTESKMGALGGMAPSFNLKGIDGKMHSLDEYAAAEVFVAVFMCNHCPYVQKIWPAMIAFVTDLPTSVQFVGINSNSNPDYPEDSFENMIKYAGEKGQNFPYLFDGDQSVAKAYGAVCTPDFFVFDAERNLSYRGNFEGVVAAVNNLLKGKAPDQNQRPSMGCSIKWQN